MALFLAAVDQEILGESSEPMEGDQARESSTWRK